MLTLHHLRHSRSIRILWLIEELGVAHDLVVHERTADHRAPPALLAVHPLGKAPVLVDDALVLAESSAILRYLDGRYGGDRFSPPAGSAARAHHDEWLDFVEGSAAMPVMMGLLGTMTGGLSDPLQAFVQARRAQMLDHVAAAVAERPFLMGDRVQLADMQMSFLLAVASANAILDDRPVLRAYLARLLAQPGMQRAVARGGPIVSRPLA